MRSLFALILLWIAFQFAVMSFSGFQRSSPAGHGRPSPARLHAALESWPESSRRLALEIVEEYGLPDGVGRQTVWWIRPDQTRIIVYRGAAPRSSSPRSNPNEWTSGESMEMGIGYEP